MPIVKELKLNNFYNYSNEILYEFKEGINIVVADNNGGKSKLYNAFLWILKDKVFDSDSRTYTTLIDPRNQFKLISDKAKNDVADGDTITTSVSLTFENDFSKKQSDLGVTTYTVIKTIKAKKIQKGSSFSYENWSVSLEKPIFICKRGYETNQITENAQEIVTNCLLPHSLQNYYMFQGEEISKLVGKDLTMAIEKITGIKRFNYFENYLIDIVSKSKKAFDNEKKKIAKNTKMADEWAIDIERIENTVEKHSKRIIELKKEFEAQDQKYSSLHEQYTDALSQHTIIQKISQTEEKIIRSRNDLEQIEQNYNNNFFEEKWVLYGIDMHIRRFIDLRNEYNKNKSKKSAESFVSSLPHNIPDVPSLDQMIRERHCSVCDRPISENEDAWEYIQKLRDRNSSKDKKNYQINQVNVFIDQLFQQSGNIPKKEKINQTEQKIKERIISLNRDLEDLTILKNSLEEQQSKEKQAVIKIVKDYKECGNLKEKIGNDLRSQENLKNNAKIDLKSLREKFDKLAGVDKIDPGYQRKLEILEDLLEAFYEAKRQHYDEQAMSLSSDANKDYEDLTLGNQTAPGSIEITVSSDFQFNSQLNNPEGGILSGQGTAFQRMKQLSLLLGIVKLGQNNEYPLIADAPVSELSPLLTKNFFHTVPKNFKQSILLVKDLIDDSSNDIDNIHLNSLGNEIMNTKYLDPRIYINNARGKEQHHRVTTTLLIQA